MNSRYFKQVSSFGTYRGNYLFLYVPLLWYYINIGWFRLQLRSKSWCSRYLGPPARGGSEPDLEHLWRLELPFAAILCKYWMVSVTITDLLSTVALLGICVPSAGRLWPRVLMAFGNAVLTYPFATKLHKYRLVTVTFTDPAPDPSVQRGGCDLDLQCIRRIKTISDSFGTGYEA